MSSKAKFMLKLVFWNEVIVVQRDIEFQHMKMKKHIIIYTKQHGPFPSLIYSKISDLKEI